MRKLKLKCFNAGGFEDTTRVRNYVICIYLLLRNCSNPKVFLNTCASVYFSNQVQQTAVLLFVIYSLLQHLLLLLLYHQFFLWNPFNENLFTGFFFLHLLFDFWLMIEVFQDPVYFSKVIVFVQNLSLLQRLLIMFLRVLDNCVPQ